MMIERLLIANRGEIACRIIATCRKMGVRSIVVYSEADRDSLAVQQADEAFCIGAAPASASYLNIEAILEAARRTCAQAVHPGFGFLAENADFASAVVAAGLIFVGPRAETIAALGSKARAKELAMEVGVPVLAGYAGIDQDDARLEAEAERIGYPLMVKAAAGGGGRGLRRLDRADGLHAALAGARAEAAGAFGDDRLILETALDNPRHIEVQVLGDHHGRLIHLGERDCSLQRRHQKILEEAPAPNLSEELRWHMQRSALKVAEAAGYTNAGTVEFLVQGGRFYFLEMNTRLQVEHPVTEAITGVDLVEWQIRIAQGEPLNLPALDFVGHAVEVRLYAEEPASDYRPSPGKVLLWQAPEHVRVECGIESGDFISSFYDPMVAKLIAWGEDRPAALRRLRRALEATCLLGVHSNQAQLLSCLNDPELVAGKHHTGTVGEQPFGARPPFRESCQVAAVAFWLSQGENYWRNNLGALAPVCFHHGSDVLLKNVGADLEVDGQEVRVISFQLPEIVLEMTGHRQRFLIAQRQDEWWVWSLRGVECVTMRPRFPQALASDLSDGRILAPLTGSIRDILVQVGDAVEAGQPLMRLEAMKMEHVLVSPRLARVSAVYCSPGDVVEAKSVLMELD